MPENTKFAAPLSLRDTSISSHFKNTYIHNWQLNVDKDSVRSRLFALGDSLLGQGSFVEFIKLYNLFEPFLHLWKNTPKAIQVFSVHYNNIGVAHMYLSNYDKALAYYLYALSIAQQGKKEENFLMQCRTLSNMGVVFYELGDTAKSEYYVARTYNIAKQKQFKSGLAVSAISLGNKKREKLNFDQAIKYYQEALDAVQKPQSKESMDIWTVAITQLAYVYILKNDPKKAISYLTEKSPSGFESTNPLYKNVGLITTLGDAYLMIKDYKGAEKAYNNALRYAYEMGAKGGVADLYQRLSKLYHASGDQHRAYDFLSKHIDLYKKTLNVNTLKEINTLEIKYRIFQKDKEIAEKQMQLAESDRKLMQKNIWILSISSGTLALIMITILIIRNFKNRQRLNNSKQENIRLKALIDGEEKERNRIAQDLHDGIGGLLSAAKMSLSTAYPKLEPQLAQYTNGIKLLDEAYKDLRQTAHNLSPEILKHKGLWEAIRIYSEKIGHNKNLTINFETIGDLPLLHQETELSIYRILQELLQNIVKHAHASLAIVQISANDGILHIMVEDNGHGIVAKEQPNGIGLNSIHSRVEALEGRIDIDSRLAEGTTIYIEFSIHKLTQETHLADQVISAK